MLVLRVAHDLGVELGLGEGAVDVALELDHVDAVGGEAAQRLVERGRPVADAEREGGDHRPVLGIRVARLAGQDQEAGGVVLGVLDVGLQDLEAVDLGGEPRGDGGPGRVAGGGDLGGGARRCRRPRATR